MRSSAKTKQLFSKINKEDRTKKFINSKNKTAVVMETSQNILSTNASDMKYKESDLKEKVKFFNSSIFAVQETHYKQKGKFKMQDYQIFESIRKNKDQGGSMLGIHMGLQPVLISEYSDSFELLVVEIVTGNQSIRVMTGYGPQENWEDKERMPFYTALETEIAPAELQGKSVIISLDANAKLGPTYIPNNPKDMSKNGKVLSAILERHALSVANGLKEKCLITRERSTVNGIEQSVIDFVIVSCDLVKHIEYIHIDEKQIHVLTKNLKTKHKNKVIKSDHNIIETKINLKWKTKDAKVVEVFKFKDTEAQNMFKEETNKTLELSNIVNSKKPLEIVTKKLVKRIKGFIHSNFQKIKIIDKPNEALEKLYNKRRLLRTQTDDDSIQELEDVENELSEKYSEVMFKTIMKEVKGLDDCEDGGFNTGKLWKLKQKLSPRTHDPLSPMTN